MKYKILFLLAAVLFGDLAFSQSGMTEVRRSFRPSAIQSTNMVFKDNSSSLYSSDALNAALKELQNKISLQPDDYSLYVPLIDLYIRTRQNDKAYNELVFLSNLSRQDKLSYEVKNEISKLLDKLKRTNKYDRSKASLYVNMALMSLIIDDKEGAETYITSASKGNIDTKIIQDVITKVFDLDKNPNKAIEICNNIVLNNPDNVDIRKLKASYLMQMKNNDAAIDEYINVLTVNQNDKEAKYNLYKLLSLKNYSDKDIIKKMYPQDSQNLEKIYSELADILLKNNDIQGAKKWAELLKGKFPQNETSYMVLAEIYQKEGNLQASYEALSKLRDTADSNEAIAKYNVMLAKLSDEPVKEANSLMATGLYQQALDVLSSAAQENLYVILTQVRANYMLSNKQTAMELLNKAMSLYPDNSDVYCAFGWVYLQEKEIDTARKYTDGALKLNPQNQTAKELLDMVNQAESDTFMSGIISSYENQNYTQTMTLIDEAMQINKKDYNLYFYKALTYIAQNNYAASTAPLYKSIELNKNYAPSYFYLALAFDNLSESQNALEYYKQYINMLKDDDYSETERKEYANSRITQLNNH